MTDATEVKGQYFFSRVNCFFCLSIILLTASCRQDKIEVYRVAKEDASPTPFHNSFERPQPAEPPSPSHATGSDRLNWKIPEGWQDKGASGMRYASFLIHPSKDLQAEVSVVVLEGTAGGDLANINRWRAQLGLGPIDQHTLSKNLMQVKTQVGSARFVDFTREVQKSQPSFIAAILSHQGSTWFFKLMGPNEAVIKTRPTFMEFLKSLRAREEKNL